MPKPYAKSFYASKQWREMREYVFKRDGYLCCLCGRPATEVHHVRRITPDNINDVRVTVNADNLESLCSECHKRIHETDRHAHLREAGWRYDADGMPYPPGNYKK